MEEGFFPESASKVYMEKEDRKPCSWWCYFTKDDCCQNQWPMATIVSIDADEKNDVLNVTLCVADKKAGLSQISGFELTIQ